jgi:hypothetical protein
VTISINQRIVSKPHRLVKGRMGIESYALEFAKSISYPQDTLEKAEIISKHLDKDPQVMA